MYKLSLLRNGSCNSVFIQSREVQQRASQEEKLGQECVEMKTELGGKKSVKCFYSVKFVVFLYHPGSWIYAIK